MKKNIVIFSEEYSKITKGMFNVWKSHAQEASRNKNVSIILNREHWGFVECREFFQDNSNVIVVKLPFYMIRTFFNKITSSGNNFLFRAFAILVELLSTFFLAPFFIIFLTFYLRRQRIDVIYSHNGGWPGGPLCRWIILAAMFAGVQRRVFIVHSHPSKHTKFILRIVYTPLNFIQARIIDFSATSIVTVSESVKRELENEIFKKPIERIYNGINLSNPDNYKPTLDWSPTSDSVIGFVGALYPYKGAHVLLDAFREIQLKCELVFLGPGEPRYLSLLKTKSELCNNKVSFLGFHPDVESFMAKINILVVPSIAYESFGLVILEAMKNKKPVVCSNYGGMKEVVDDGVTGFVVESSNAKMLADVLIKLLSDKALQQKMGNAGFNRLMSTFTAEKMESEYDKLS